MTLPHSYQIIFPNKWHFDDFVYVLSFTKNFIFIQLAQNLYSQISCFKVELPEEIISGVKAFHYSSCEFCLRFTTCDRKKAPKMLFWNISSNILQSVFWCRTGSQPSQSLFEAVLRHSSLLSKMIPSAGQHAHNGIVKMLMYSKYSFPCVYCVCL